MKPQFFQPNAPSKESITLVNSSEDYNSKSISSSKECEDIEILKEENIYDHLEFNGPVKKLEPHYHSSKTLKSLASMDREIEL